MWMPDSLCSRQTTLDFGASGQGQRRVTQIVADDVVLLNAVELVEWNSDSVQLILCDQCGFTHCSPGGWVAFRAAGEYVIIAPAFDRLMGRRDPDWSEYRPPDFLKMRGNVLLDRPRYESLRECVPSLPVASELQRLRCDELVHLLQWEAPYRLLGDPQQRVAVRRELILAASEGAAEDWAVRIQGLMNRLQERQVPAVVRPLSADDHVVDLYLDTPEFSTWSVLANADSEDGVLLPPGLVAVAMAGEPAA